MPPPRLPWPDRDGAATGRACASPSPTTWASTTTTSAGRPSSGQDPRLFFDTGAEWALRGDIWFAHWLADTMDLLDGAVEHARPQLESTRAHNLRGRERDRSRAIALDLGPALPYLKKVG